MLAPVRWGPRVLDGFLRSSTARCAGQLRRPAPGGEGRGAADDRAEDRVLEASWEPEDGRLQRQRPWRSACPFTVHRTKSDNIPVYVFKRKNRTEAVTVVRKTRGDPEALRKELQYLCQCPVMYGKNGFLELIGNHRRVIKAYLTSIGY